MTLRPIEMQTSFPRSQTVGKIQDQLQQRAQVMAEHVATEQKEKTEHKLKKVNESEKSDRGTLEPDKEEKREQKEREGKKRKKVKKEKKVQVEHPYKGKFIDFSG